jgi:hypothetical protein
MSLYSLNRDKRTLSLTADPDANRVVGGPGCPPRRAPKRLRVRIAVLDLQAADLATTAHLSRLRGDPDLTLFDLRDNDPPWRN